MNLLKITHLPIQYQYETEPAKLEMNKTAPSQGRIRRQPSKLSVDSSNVKVNINNDKARESMNMRTSSSWARDYAMRGERAAQQATGESVQFGNQLQQIEDGVTIGQVVRSKMLQKTPDSVLVFIPSVGPEIQWEEPKIDMSYDPGSINMDWQIMKNVFNFVPGKFNIEITQYPSISIEYIGPAMYVPPSAAPDYVAPAE